VTWSLQKNWENMGELKYKSKQLHCWLHEAKAIEKRNKKRKTQKTQLLELKITKFCIAPLGH
jgi:hypothetical protein